ncbi:hypothetical protein D5278_14505 [bacterium 1XD21-13]|nr:hypothetical protein [bacterium 1XD21-13]
MCIGCNTVKRKGCGYMRRHTVHCCIEGDKKEARKIVYQAANQCFTEKIERFLKESGWEKEMQIALLDRLIDSLRAGENTHRG